MSRRRSRNSRPRTEYVLVEKPQKEKSYKGLAGLIMVLLVLAGVFWIYSNRMALWAGMAPTIANFGLFLTVGCGSAAVLLAMCKAKGLATKFGVVAVIGFIMQSIAFTPMS